MAPDTDPLRKIESRLRDLERKIDVLIEGQGLEGLLAQRQATDRAKGREVREGLKGKVSRTYPRQ